MTRRAPLLVALLAVAAAALAACGKEGITLSAKRGDTAQIKHGAQLFAARCAGCHTLGAAGTHGSATKVNDRERTDGPNLDQRKEDLNSVLFAIRNGGFSGAIMPQNIVVGADAQKVAAFVSKYAGKSVVSSPGPSTTTSPSSPAPSASP